MIAYRERLTPTFFRVGAGFFAFAWAAVLSRPVWNYYIIELRHAALADKLFPFYPLLFLPLFIHRLRPGDSPRSLFFLAPAAALVCLLGAYTGVQTLIWLGGVWLGLLGLRVFGRRVSAGGFLLFLLMPPVSAKTTLVLGFRLRLWLTEAAANVLALTDPAIQVLGNTLLFQGREFAVDPACEGMKMLTACGLLFLILARDTGGGDDPDRSSFAGRMLSITMLAGATFLLWLLANLARIILLVFANIGPDSPRHGLAGLVIFCLVVVFPLLMARALPSLLRAPREDRQSPMDIHPVPAHPALHSMAILIMVALAALVWFMPRHAPAGFQPWPTAVAGFGDFRPGTKTDGKLDAASEIAVYSRGDARLILKQGLNPLRVGHHPRRCWQGLGYKFTKENDLKIPGAGIVRLARISITKNGTRNEYRLAWWYQSADAGAIDSSELRWRAEHFSRGRNFVQVNIFAPGEGDILELIRRTAKARLTKERPARVRPAKATAFSAAGP